MTNQNILYYDGACPLCSAEMDRLDRLSDEGLALVDIHSAPKDDLPNDPQLLLKTLHLALADGRVLTGVDANVAAWEHTKWASVFRWMRWPGVRWVTDAVYDAWSSRRYEKLYGREGNER